MGYVLCVGLRFSSMNPALSLSSPPVPSSNKIHLPSSLKQQSKFIYRQMADFKVLLSDLKSIAVGNLYALTRCKGKSVLKLSVSSFM
ncbi:hypothetical protein YC2023_095560 [Brassica napus]